jgi:hypothetical protein
VIYAPLASIPAPRASIEVVVMAERYSRHYGTSGVEDYQLALATYRCERWTGTPITLRQGARVIEDSRRARTASWSNKGSREGGR